MPALRASIRMRLSPRHYLIDSHTCLPDLDSSALMRGQSGTARAYQGLNKRGAIAEPPLMPREAHPFHFAPCYPHYMLNPDILSKADKALRPVLTELSKFQWIRIEGCCAGHKA